MILLPTQHLFDPTINLGLGFAFEANRLAGVQESLDLLQAQFLCFVHMDGQSSACHPLQAHLVLESPLPFRLILYWIRLSQLVLLRNPNTLHILIHSRRVLASVLAAKWVLSGTVQRADSRAYLLRNQNKGRCLYYKGLASIS